MTIKKAGPRWWYCILHITNQKRLMFLSLCAAAVVGFAAPDNLKILLLILGLIGYVILVLAATRESNIKRCIPPFLLFILFQDTIINLLGSMGVIFSYLDELFVLICVPALMINFLRGKKIAGGYIFLSMVGMVLFGMVSSILHSNPFNITFQGMQLMIKGLLYVFVFANISFTRADLLHYVKWVKVAAIGVLIFSVVDLAMPSAFRGLLGITASVDYRVGVPSLQSLFIHPGIYGWFMTLVGIYLAVNYKIKTDPRYFYWACVFFFFALLSFRFKTIVSILVIAFIFYLLSGMKKMLTFIIPAAVVVAIVYLFAGNYIMELTDLTFSRYIEVDVMKSARKAMYYFAFIIANENFPFGVGFGRYGGYIAKEYYSPVYYEYGMNTIYGLTPENPMWAMDTYWPYVLGELGYLGAGVLLALFIYLIVKLISNYKSMVDPVARHFVLFAGLVLIHALIESSGEPVFNSSPQNVFIFTASGIALSIVNARKKAMDLNTLKNQSMRGHLFGN
ncbi:MULTISPECIES: O-antigen ligase family protein [Paenibacillus]|nr:O-antigen ligase family protein [Paenibacillus lactis]